MNFQMSRAERRRQAREDEKLLAAGIDAQTENPEPVAAMARLLLPLFEKAKREQNIDPPVNFLYAKANATLKRLKNIPVACSKGCSHCCHIRVSASAPEILFTAKIIRQRASGLAQRVYEAHLNTKAYDAHARVAHPYPCPLLESDACSIYESRPLTCRYAASADAAVCLRAYRNSSKENIPTPLLNVSGRNAYALAMAATLKRAGFPHYAYELNAGLARALEVDAAEELWLGGQDIFADVTRDSVDVFSQSTGDRTYRQAFG